MKFILCSIALVAVFVFAAEALPQYGQYHAIRAVPYSSQPETKYELVRNRRQLGGSLTSNPAGGADAKLGLGHTLGTPTHNVAGQVFAAGNTLGGPVTTGGALGYNLNGHGVGISKTHTPGVSDVFTQTAHANLFNNGRHNVDANVFASQNKLANGFEFQRNGAGLDYSHINGHGASVTHSNFPGIGQQLNLGGKANVWSSQDRATRLDLTGSASKWTSGPMSSQPTNFGAGLGLTHFFG